jgi:hypothetical protein
MLAVPYLILGGFGWFVYRGLKVTAKSDFQESSETTP